jgi:dihydrofolate reductase
LFFIWSHEPFDLHDLAVIGVDLLLLWRHQLPTHAATDLPSLRGGWSDLDVTYLSGDIGEAVATALAAAGGKDLQILGADVAGQCLRRGLVDEILVHVLPVLLGDGVRCSSPGLARIDLEPVSSTDADGVTMLRFRVRK